MSIPFAFFTFLNAFWIMAFFAIPLATQHEKNTEESKSAIEGYAAAPKSIHWKKAFIIASTLALFVTIGLAIVIDMVK